MSLKFVESHLIHLEVIIFVFIVKLLYFLYGKVNLRHVFRLYQRLNYLSWLRERERKRDTEKERERD